MISTIYLYKPLETSSKTLDADDFKQYVAQNFWSKQLEQIVIDPFEKAFKKSGLEKIESGPYVVKKAPDVGDSTSWERVYTKFREYLEIRSRDDKEVKKKGVELVQGVGYVIRIDEVLRYLHRRITFHTEHKDGITIVFPSRKNGKYVRSVEVPDLDFRVANKDTAYVAAQAHLFKNSIVTEVVDRFKDDNKRWFEDKNGFGSANPPPKDKSPMVDWRNFGELNYATVLLSRVETPKYNVIMKTIITELTALQFGERGDLSELYRPTDGKVNVNKLKERLEQLSQDPHNVQTIGRFIITP